MATADHPRHTPIQRFHPIRRNQLEQNQDSTLKLSNSRINNHFMIAPDSADCTPFLKALGDKTRWRIVEQLLSGTKTVNELADLLKVSQYNVSKQLRMLSQAGIVETEKRGKYVHCRMVPEMQRNMAKNKNQLDLGCCVFKFEPKCC